MPDPDLPVESCSVCGRTILAGEVTRSFLSRDREVREVCSLCRPRAEASGWIPAERAEALVPDSSERGRGRGRVRRFFDRARESAAIANTRSETGDEPAYLPEPPPPPPVQPPPAPSAAKRPSQRRSVPQSPESRIRRAFQSFNASEHPRMIAGLIRSLGPPSVAGATNGDAPADVRITVAWQLAWYQWEVDLSQDGAPVSQVAKGDEVAELGEGDRHWNGHATTDGKLAFGREEAGADA